MTRTACPSPNRRIRRRRNTWRLAAESFRCLAADILNALEAAQEKPLFLACYRERYAAAVALLPAPESR